LLLLLLKSNKLPYFVTFLKCNLLLYFVGQKVFFTITELQVTCYYPTLCASTLSLCFYRPDALPDAHPTVSVQ